MEYLEHNQSRPRDRAKLRMIRRAGFAAARFLPICLVLSAAGCNKSIEYLDEMEMISSKEELLEFSLGEYRVPVPATPEANATQWAHRNAMHVEFDLFAVIEPSEEKELQASWTRNEPIFRDDVMSICRAATLDELTEPGMSILKGRLTEASRRRIGKKLVRRLVVSSVTVAPL